MKNKNVKELAVVVALVAVCGLTTGCGSANVENVLSQEADTTIEVEATQEVEPTAEVEVSQETESTVEEEDRALSGDWADMQFVLGGKSYQLPFAYKELEAEGWSFDLADYGYENGYVMNPGDSVFATIKLTNPAYSDRLAINVGFKNCSDSVLDIMECDIWSLEFNTCYGFKQVDTYPDMTIGNGLTLGSTREEVEAVCGPCDDIYESTDNGYAVYSYNVDYTYYLKVTVYDTLGVTAFDLTTYK